MADEKSANTSPKTPGKIQRQWIFLLFSFFWFVLPILFVAPTLFLFRLQDDSTFMHGPFEYVKSIKFRDAGMIDGAFELIHRVCEKMPVHIFMRSGDKLKNISNETYNETETRRVGCREYPNGGESCVFTGIACVDLNKEPQLRSADGSRHLVYLVDDNRSDGETVSNDAYCQKRNISADPKYYGPKEWPPRDDYFAPRHSCLNAQWRTTTSLFGNKTNPTKVRWLEETSLIDLDFLNIPQFNHYLTSTAWMLDVALWQERISQIDSYPTLFEQPKHVLFPQRFQHFIDQVYSTDVNRLNLAIILGLDARELYRGQKSQPNGVRHAKPFMDAFPEAKERFIFYADKPNKDRNDLVCTKKLSVGPRLVDLGHERVCNHIRNKTWELFNITLPPLVAAGGFLVYHRPPRRVVLRQRANYRGFLNIEDLETALRTAASEYNFEFEFPPVRANPAEEEVRIYANAGVLVTTHHVPGALWMPKHSAVIEVHPPGFTDFTFNIRAKACNLWYFEIQGIIPKKYRSRYQRECGRKLNTPFDHCHSMRNYFVEAPVEETVQTVIKALTRLGHDMRIKNT